MQKISVTILSKNSSHTIKRCLDSLALFDEIILLDNGSTDATLEITASYPQVKIFKSPFIGFGPLHNKAIELSKNDWILSLDSDEWLSNATLEEIKNLSLDPEKAYSFRRKNYFSGKWIQGCGWHPDRVIRLFHRKHAKFTSDLVHEKVITDGLIIEKLNEPIEHEPYRTIEDFLNKMQKYSTLYADAWAHKKKSSLFIAITHAGFTLFKNLVLQRGILLGAEGWIISLYNAHTAYYKYLKLRERNKESPSETKSDPT